MTHAQRQYEVANKGSDEQKIGIDTEREREIIRKRFQLASHSNQQRPPDSTWCDQTFFPEHSPVQQH